MYVQCIYKDIQQLFMEPSLNKIIFDEDYGYFSSRILVSLGAQVNKYTI